MNGFCGSLNAYQCLGPYTVGLLFWTQQSPNVSSYWVLLLLVISFKVRRHLVIKRVPWIEAKTTLRGIRSVTNPTLYGRMSPPECSWSDGCNSCRDRNRDLIQSSGEVCLRVSSNLESPGNPCVTSLSPSSSITERLKRTMTYGANLVCRKHFTSLRKNENNYLFHKV